MTSRWREEAEASPEASGEESDRQRCGGRETDTQTDRQRDGQGTFDGGRQRQREGISRNRPKGVLNPGVTLQREMPPGWVKCVTKSAQCQALAQNSETLW